MADEYFDYDHAYNFRDRDALLIGAVVPAMRASFERFWQSELAAPVESLYDGVGLMRRHVTVRDEEVQAIYRELGEYAAAGANFAPEVRAAIDAIPAEFPQLAAELVWGRVDFISDTPGKNDGREGLGGGGLSTRALAALLESAQREVLIQSPYLVLSDEALAMFRALRQRGVRVCISTNSLASTDNLQAFSGYRRQREELLAMGVELREFRPHPQIEREVMQRYAALRAKSPVFALHAKTLVVDRSSVFIGTYNLDPRSENLNTEVGVIIHDAVQAQRVAASIDTDMLPENSWNPAAEDSDKAAGWTKRMKVRFWQLLPLRAVL